MDNMFSYFKQKYRLMSEAEILKMAFSSYYYSENQGNIPTNKEMLAMLEEGNSVSDKKDMTI